MNRIRISICTAVCAILLSMLQPDAALGRAKIRTLIIDGQNNHQWELTTSVLKAVLENSGLFKVNVATSPPRGGDMSNFRPHFSSYDLVVLNYNGDSWPEATKKDFVDYVRGGGGIVVYHAADNPFPDWPEYNEIIGLGGWEGRDEKAGPYVRWRNGRFVRDTEPGRAGSHGKRHEYVIDNRAPDHPIMKGLPDGWLHSTDELYDRMRGPAKNLEVLATAYSDPKTGGSGEHEPILMTIRFGEGRVFHTMLGDNVRPMFNIGFQVTLLRGAEWAAAGEVTVPVPPVFPSRTEIATCDPFVAYVKDCLGWTPLFNTKDLTGWKRVNGQARYEVLRDTGEIVGHTVEGSPNSFLATTREYGDFELRFEVKLDNPELNSGVQIRSHQYEEEKEFSNGNRSWKQPKGRVYGYQVEIEALDEEGFSEAGYIYDEARRGWLSPDERRADKNRGSVFRNGQWNQYFVRCLGDHIETWINGVKIADLRDSMTPKGRIMLQVHQIPKDKGPYSVRWRNILIRELD